MSFSAKQLMASITINPSSSTPTFNAGASSTVTFGGAGANAVRMRAQIHNSGGIDQMLNLWAFGLPLTVMNQLSTYGTKIIQLPKNQIIVSAGDDDGLSQVFQGGIISCSIEFSQPEAALHIVANAMAPFAAMQTNPNSYNGATDVATAMQTLAGVMGLSFENSGVNVKLSNSYFYGSPKDQFNQIREHANIGADVSNGTLSIWPMFKNRKGNVIQLSPTDGSLIDYPTYNATGVLMRALFNPDLGLGKQVQLQSSQITGANGTWNIFSIDHDLESQNPDGKWECVLNTYSPSGPAPATG